jgi:tetratricopeptide (TPR) repeat protein
MAAPSTEPSSTSSTKPLLSDVTTVSRNGNDAGVKPVASIDSAKIEDSIERQSGSHVEPNYFSSQKSEWFASAKLSLEQGDFEAALATIEQGIHVTKTKLQSCKTGIDDTSQIVDELHESLAPFHYMYGTTLLYSIEESDDNQAMTVGGGIPAENSDDDWKNGEIEENGDGEANRDDMGSNDIDAQIPNDNDGPISSDDVAEDMQIAWENLELSRATIENMLKDCGTLDNIQVLKLKSDLAQIYLREGDLQRMNGKYELAISDYDRTVELLSEQTTIDNRKVADVHYSLGLTYFMLVAAAQSSSEGDDTETPPLDETKLNFARGRGYYHYLECGMLLGGMMASLSSISSERFYEDVLKEIPQLKSSPEDDTKQHIEDLESASTKMNSLRKQVRLLPVQYDDINTMLDDIQETIDEVENSENGLREIMEMKEIIAAAAAAETDDTPENNHGASVTTIGFGVASSAAAATDNTVSAATPINVTTVPSRKKEKKRVLLPIESNNDDTRKRLKSEETKEN